MSWENALGLFFITVVAQALLQRSYAQKSKLPESFPPFFSYLIGVTPLGLLAGFVLRHHVQWSWWLVVLLISEGTFIGLYNWLSFRAIRRLPLAEFQTIYQIYELVVIALGWILLNEGLNLHQIIGGILILTASLLAVRSPKGSDRHWSKNTYAIGLAVASAVAMGIGLVSEKAALGHMDIGAYYIFGYGTQTLALFVLALKDMRRSTFASIQRYDLKRFGSMGILSALIGFFYIMAIVFSNNISLITALSAFSLPLIVVSGYIILHERVKSKIVWLSVAIGFVGLLVSAL